MAAAAVTIPNALTAMRDSDDSIAEIDAMIPRLLKMKKQLIAQKEYIEVAIKSASEGPLVHAAADATDGPTASAAAALNGGKCVDYRVNLYKHRNLISRLSTDANAGALTDVHGTITTANTVEAGHVLTKMQNRAKKNGGDESTGGIFKAGQFIKDLATAAGTADAPADPEQQNGSVFNGVDITGTKQFLIGVNAILTHPNDKTASLTAGSDSADNAYDETTDGNARKFNSTGHKYIAGGKHVLAQTVIKGLLMNGNEAENPDAVYTTLTAYLGASAGGETPAGINTIRGFGL